MSSTTPHLSLLKPDADELVSVVPQINQNFDKLDAKALDHSNRLTNLEAVLGLDTEWVAWTPDGCYLGSTVIPTFNANDSFYMQVGAIVFCAVEFSFDPTTRGNGLSLGIFELPVPADSFAGMQGTGYLDTGTERIPYTFNDASSISAVAEQFAKSGTDTIIIDDSNPAGTIGGTFKGTFSYKVSTF